MDWKDQALLKAPRKGDELFKASGESWRTNARLHVTPDTGYAYSRGYRVAAQAMAQRLFDGREYEADFLVYPVAFLYRHHVELMLKRLIVMGSFLDDRGLTPVDKRHLKKHRLDLLWRILRPIVESQCSLSDEDINGISHYLDKLHEVDPESQSFRYALSIDDEPALSSIPYINVGVFAEAMERLCNCLDVIEARFGVLTDHKQEMLDYQAEFEAEMRAEYESDMWAEQAEYEAEMRAEYEAEMHAEMYADYADAMAAEQGDYETEHYEGD